VRRADHSSRGVLPTVARRVCDLENLVNEEAIARVGLQRHMKKNYYKCTQVIIQSTRCSNQILMKIEFSRRIFRNIFKYQISLKSVDW
jgi:hypothetical protein